MEYDKEQLIIKMINKFVDFKDKIVLEVGCGNGITSSLLADNKRKYIGIDPDSQSIKNANALFGNVDFRIGSGESLEFENSYFDIVLFTLSLHHQSSRLALKEANRVLAEKGRLLILEPATDGELQQFFNLFADETNKIKEALKDIKKSDFRLDQQDTFNAKATFNNQDDLCDYHFDRKKISQGDTDRIIEKLNQFQPFSADYQPIHLNDKINIYLLTKEASDKKNF